MSAPKHEHVDVGRDGEDAARLLDAAHVQQRDEHDEHHAELRRGGRRRPANAGIEMIAATPAEIDTATVST